jgi:hypothetical protein
MVVRRRITSRPAIFAPKHCQRRSLSYSQCESSGLFRMGSVQRPSVRVLMMAIGRMRVRVPQRLVSMPMAMRPGRLDGVVMRVVVMLIV